LYLQTKNIKTGTVGKSTIINWIIPFFKCRKKRFFIKILFWENYSVDFQKVKNRLSMERNPYKRAIWRGRNLLEYYLLLL